ncbi:hypothetical protein L1049_016023 [Liquidambar formosana]|uniref:DNA/RNA-binding protein Alba-like domain-containing protein n=1 Tax=Liquidambar formosana TaxID=63359 RepID=A0AAP0X6I1_LIQFO
MTEASVVAEGTAMKETVVVVVGGKTDETQKKHRIQVSNTKKPLFFYLNLAKKYIKQRNDVELSALGMAIPTVVTIAEILKSNGLAIVKEILISTVGSRDDAKGRPVQKAKIEIVLGKTENIEDLTTAAENIEGLTTAAAAAAKTSEKAADDKKELNSIAQFHFCSLFSFFFSSTVFE